MLFITYNGGVKRNAAKIVLVGVLKTKRDLDILLLEKWYRVPEKYAPTKHFKYLAFYEPATFDRRAKRIRYYARVLGYRMATRGDLLPGETGHPMAREPYLRFRIGKIKKLRHPIKNIVPRRISFGFTTLKRLLTSKNILELYDVASTEQIIGDLLKHTGLQMTAQHNIAIDKKRFRIDFALFCRRGKVAIECDNKKAHSRKQQRKKDREKDRMLRHAGWRVIRLQEKDIIERPSWCLAKITKIVRHLGGQQNTHFLFS
ncbi:MAG: DUF559 domain-containing protein [Patescibacteria group bacterium]